MKVIIPSSVIIKRELHSFICMVIESSALRCTNNGSAHLHAMYDYMNIDEVSFLVAER